jgi:hypothetical protein
MSVAPALSNDEYDERRRVLEEIKGLTKTEHLKILQILREGGAEFSENSNGVFFDVAKLSADSFRKVQAYLEFCHAVRKDQAEREAEMDGLRDE